MSQENVEIVQGGLEHFQQDPPAASLTRFRYTGREGTIEQFRSALRRLFTEFELTTDRASPSGYSLRPWVRPDHVVAPRLADGRPDWEAAQASGLAVQRVALDLSDNLCSLLAAW